MPGEGRRSITVSDRVFERLNQDRQHHALTWDALLITMHNAWEREGDGQDEVVVTEIAPGVLDDLSGRVAREVRDELDGGTL